MLVEGPHHNPCMQGQQDRTPRRAALRRVACVCAAKSLQDSLQEGLCVCAAAETLPGLVARLVLLLQALCTSSAPHSSGNAFDQAHGTCLGSYMGSRKGSQAAGGPPRRNCHSRASQAPSVQAHGLLLVLNWLACCNRHLLIAVARLTDVGKQSLGLRCQGISVATGAHRSSCA